ncbi:MAG TPA: CpsD/CapB family tyrosine-protein kinase [Candidatus Acidoferrales bacterium]|jgi:capsular exopolysaccharide synthesis family protein|nr:CpsD/CapB family tyrosine-protein kinase [Candidatus Acidoferrales bacterium]
MSRIHEALKRAEQDRAVMLPVDTPLVPTGSVEVKTNGGSRAPVAAADVYPKTSVIGSAPSEYLRFDDLTARCAHPRWNPDPNVNVFLNPDLGSHAAEQFRTLRSRLYQLQAAQPLRTILITSSLPADGKTFLSNNLAQAFVQQPDRRVLLIDGDLRRSRLHVPLGAPASPGLTEYLRGDSDEMAVIQHGREGNLCFISGGNEVADPSELLSNGRLKLLLDRVTPVFDWVIVDSPPCLPVADSSVLADLCDGVLVVVRAGSTPVEAAQKMCQGLNGRNVLGVVLNAVQDKRAYSHYYGHYGSSGDQDRPKESRK